MYPNYHACLAARHVEKVREATPRSSKVIGVHCLNFKPFFKCSFSKIVGDPVPGGVCANKPWSISSVCRTSGGITHRGQSMFSKKVDLCGSKLSCPTLLLVDQSSPDFFRPMRDELLSIVSFDISIRSRDTRDRSLKLSEIAPNFAAPKFFGEGSPNFGTWIIKFNTLPIMRQSFRAIGPARSSEISH